MVLKRVSFRYILPTFIYLITSGFLTSCTQHNQSPLSDTNKRTATGACTYETSDRSIVCSSEAKVSEDETIFIGGENGTPVDYEIMEDGSTRFLIPPGYEGRDVEICVKTADQPCRSIGSVHVDPLPETPSDLEDDLTPTPDCHQTGCAEGYSCEENGTCRQLVTTNPGTNPTPGECVPVCSSGQTCQNGRCVVVVTPTPPPAPTPTPTPTPPPAPTPTPTPTPPPAPAPTPTPQTPLTVEFETGAGKTEELHRTKLGLVAIKPKISRTTGLRAYYIYGVWNRSRDGQSCGEISQNDHLISTRSGSPFQQGTALYQNHESYLTGIPCDQDSTCKDLETHFPRISVEATPDRNQTEESRSENLRLKRKVSMVEAVGVATLLRKNTVCKVDLLSPGIDGGLVLYTIIQQPQAKFVLVAEDTEGNVVTDTHTFTAPQPSISSLSANPSTLTVVVTSQSAVEQPVFTISFDYANAVTPPTVSGCTRHTDDPNPTEASGTAHFDCLVRAQDQRTTVTVVGVGGQLVSHEISIHLDPVTLTKFRASQYKCSGETAEAQWHQVSADPNPDCHGLARLEWEIVRHYNVIDTTDNNRSLASGAVSWVPSVNLAAIGGDPVSVASRGTFDAIRNYDYNEWSLEIVDFPLTVSAPVPVATILGRTSLKFIPSLNVANARVSDFAYAFDFDTCGDFNEGGCCDPYYQAENVRYPDHTTQGIVHYNGTHASETRQATGCYHDSSNGAFNCREYQIQLEETLEVKHLKEVIAVCHLEGENRRLMDWDKAHFRRSIRKDPPNGRFTELSDVFPGEYAHCFYYGVPQKGTIMPPGTRPYYEAIEFPDNQRRIERPQEGFCDGPDQDSEDCNDAGHDDTPVRDVFTTCSEHPIS